MRARALMEETAFLRQRLVRTGQRLVRDKATFSTMILPPKTRENPFKMQKHEHLYGLYTHIINRNNELIYNFSTRYTQAKSPPNAAK